MVFRRKNEQQSFPYRFPAPESGAALTKKLPMKFAAEGNLILVTLLWAGTFALIKSALDHISPMLFVGLRFSIAALILLPFVYKTLGRLTHRMKRDGFVLGLYFFLGFSLQTAGLNYTTATKSALITGTFVVFTPLFQYLLERKKPTMINLISAVIVFGGFMLLASPGDSLGDLINEMGSGFNFGDFLTLLCAMAYAVYIVELDIVSPRHSVKFLTFAQIAVTAVLALISAAFFDVTGIESIALQSEPFLWIAIGYAAIFATVLATGLQTKYQRYVTPTKAGILFAMEPVFATIIAISLLDERLTILGFSGALCIFTGLVVSEIVQSKQQNDEQPKSNKINHE